MIRKLFITPWSGDFPSWMDKYKDHINHLGKYGYDWLITTDMDDFSIRAREALGLEANITPGTPLLHNYRTAYGLMYADKLKGYDYWGITDFDCVYGEIPNFISDKKLLGLDIWSNDGSYICGPWTLFKNTEKVNNLFRLVPQWEGLMQSLDRQPGRWTEVEYSQVVDNEHNVGNINRLYTHFQGKNPDIWQNLTLKDDKLFDAEDEIMMFHFNHTKIWPL